MICFCEIVKKALKGRQTRLTMGAALRSRCSPSFKAKPFVLNHHRATPYDGYMAPFQGWEVCWFFIIYCATDSIIT